METSVVAISNVNNLTECVLELVSNSLNANATSIAVRIHAEYRKIQVVDNGIGIPMKKLRTVAEYNACNYWNVQDVCNSRKQTLINIRRLSDATFITSRYHTSSKTYMKVCKVCCAPKTVNVQRRPSRGTTVSIYGFHELSFNKWNVSLMYFLVSNIAIINPQVSFSIRDDQRRKVIMAITKPHSPVGIFKLLYNKEVLFNKLWYIKHRKTHDFNFCAYIGLIRSKSDATQYIFLNNRPAHCPLILKVVSAAFVDSLHSFVRVKHQQILKKKAVFILLFITCTDYIFTVEKGKRTLVLPNIQDILEGIKNEILNIFTNNILPFSNNMPRHLKSHTNLTYGSDFDNIKLSNRISVPRKISPEDCILHTLHRFVKSEIVKLTVPLKHRNISTRQNTKTASTVNDLNQMEIESINNQEVPRNNEVQHGTIDKIFKKNEISNLDQLLTPNIRNNSIIDQNIMLTFSEWSNWTYHDDYNKSNNLKMKQNYLKTNVFNNNSVSFYKEFDFLPKKLHKLLRGDKKLTKIDILNKMDGNIYSAQLKAGLKIPDVLFHQEMDVRPCKSDKRFHEFRLKKDLLQFIKIIGQMNNELIVGLVIQDDVKVLLLMDQHAMHERVRYENLIEKYKSQMKNQLFSVKLKEPIVIQLPVESCNLLYSNKIILQRFGINLSVTNNDTVIVRAVPECLRKNKYHYDELKLKLNVKNLLNEMLQDFTNNKCCEINNLPSTIHNAIALEACHGAIKFGDPLTLKQCKWLLKLLKNTKIPTRCAHGRPSIIPILELSQLQRRHKHTSKEKLNFAALRLLRKNKHK